VAGAGRRGLADGRVPADVMCCEAEAGAAAPKVSSCPTPGQNQPKPRCAKAPCSFCLSGRGDRTGGGRRSRRVRGGPAGDQGRLQNDRCLSAPPILFTYPAKLAVESQMHLSAPQICTRARQGQCGPDCCVSGWVLVGNRPRFAAA